VAGTRDRPRGTRTQRQRDRETASRGRRRLAAAMRDLSEKQRGRGAGTQIHGHADTRRSPTGGCGIIATPPPPAFGKGSIREGEGERATERQSCLSARAPKRAATHGLPSPHSLCLSAGLYPSASAAGSASACGPSAPLYLPLFPSVSVRHLQTTVRSATEREEERGRARHTEPRRLHTGG
jgi:hypothetical protein